MQTIKRIFIVPYLLACTLAAGHSLWQIVLGDDVSLAWYGALLAVLPMLGFMLFLGVASAARTSPYLPLQLLCALLGSLLALLQPQPGLPVFYALILGLGGVSAYVFWFSRLGRGDNAVLRVGEALPEFELEDAEGNNISSKRFLGQKLLLIFYRGNWCPLCVAQVREVVDQYRELDRRGVRVAMVSPQPHKQTRALADKFDAPLQFLVDRDNRAAKKLNIEHKGGIALGIAGYGADTVLPTVVIADESGTIVYADLTDNYRLRPEPAIFFEVLDGLTVNKEAANA